MEHEKVVLYFRGEKLHNVQKCDLINMDNGIGSVYFADVPNSEYLKDLTGRSGPLVAEYVSNNTLSWKYCREIRFYPFTQCYWDRGEIITKLDYRLTIDNTIDNMAEMLKDMKAVIESYKKELMSINVSGVLVSRLDDVLDRMDQDEMKLRQFPNQHLTTRKRLISDYCITYKEAKERMPGHD